MGCAPSKFAWNNEIEVKRRSPCCNFLFKCATASSSSPPAGAAELNEDIDLNLHKVLRLQPSISIEIGSGVNQPTEDRQQSVIFLIGGPGCLKGVLTQELAQEFDFVTIGIEELIFNYLPHKVADTVKNTVEMQTLLKRDPAVINLKWLLQMISARLATSCSQRFIVDIVPELSFIFKSNAFKMGDHSQRLDEFDRKHNVLFALELFISQEHQLLEGGSSSGLTRSSSSSSASSSSTKAKEKEDADNFTRGVDEADKGRLEKRLEAYHDCAEPFLKYFRKQKRVVKLDLKIPYNADLPRTVRQLFVDVGFSRNNDSIRVVLFLQSEYQADEIDTAYYNLRKIRLLDICHDREESLASQIRAIRKYIYRTAQLDEHILVLLKGLNNMEYPRSKQRINFVEYKTTYLDFYIRSVSRQSPRQRCRMPFRAITSTKGEVCLFPEAMSSRLCKKIGLIFGEKLSMSETSETNREANESRASQLSVSPCSPHQHPKMLFPPGTELNVPLSPSSRQSQRRACTTTAPPTT
uniref:Adenylate kinase n=1 Tax=Globodera rostochiensis TaxID=31243 RepID=A0A914GXK7_GLORO